MRNLSMAVAASALLLVSAADGHAALPNDVEVVNVHPTDTFPQILEYMQAPGDSSRYFAVLQTGQVRVVDDAEVLSAPFIDLGARTISNGEQGLLGMAFHPDFEENGLFYLSYTAGSTRPAGTNFGDSIVAEFAVTEDPNVAEALEQRIILTIHQDFSNHNGGHIAFGPDGYLYIGVGDGGSGGDPCNRSQTLDPRELSTSPPACNNPSPLPISAALLGSMLRIDVDSTTPPGANNLCAARTDGSAEYAVPVDNPFLIRPGDVFTDRFEEIETAPPSRLEGNCAEIWGYGLRNPWRYSFDQLTGDLWVADVGQNTREEVNLVPAGDGGGLNYGWKCFEGTSTFQSSSYCSGIDHFAPIMEYNTTSTNCSITGGYRYRGPVVSLQGLYLFADFCSRRLFVAAEDSPNNWSFAQGPIVGTGSSWSAGVSSFGQDHSGNIYILQRNGAVWRLEGDQDGTAD